MDTSLYTNTAYLLSESSINHKSECSNQYGRLVLPLTISDSSSKARKYNKMLEKWGVEFIKVKVDTSISKVNINIWGGKGKN